MASTSRDGAWVAVAALNGFIAVAAGAAASHVQSMGEASMSWMEIGSQYQLWHALGILVLVLLGRAEAPLLPAIARWAFLLGILLFSGNLYLMALTGFRALSWVTPIGGMSMMAGWLVLALYGLARALRASPR
jgi:uncharacterized membrane protein YgdD (TMEM256/DUF423 family)